MLVSVDFEAHNYVLRPLSKIVQPGTVSSVQQNALALLSLSHIQSPYFIELSHFRNYNYLSVTKPHRLPPNPVHARFEIGC